MHRPDGKASRDDVRTSRSQSSAGFGNCPAASGRLVSADRSAERNGTFDPETAVNGCSSRLGRGRPDRLPTPAPRLQRFGTTPRQSNPHSASLTLTASQHSAVSSLGLCPTPARWPRCGLPTPARLGRRRTTLNITCPMAILQSRHSRGGFTQEPAGRPTEAPLPQRTINSIRMDYSPGLLSGRCSGYPWIRVFRISPYVCWQTDIASRLGYSRTEYREA